MMMQHLVIRQQQLLKYEYTYQSTKLILPTKVLSYLLPLHHNTNIVSHVCRYKYTNTVEPSVGIASLRTKCRQMYLLHQTIGRYRYLCVPSNNPSGQINKEDEPLVAVALKK